MEKPKNFVKSYSKIKKFSTCLKNNLLKKSTKKVSKTVARNSKISPKSVGLQVRIHNGKTFGTLKITNEMIGYRFGEFFPTRKPFSFKKNK